MQESKHITQPVGVQELQFYLYYKPLCKKKSKKYMEQFGAEQNYTQHILVTRNIKEKKNDPRVNSLQWAKSARKDYELQMWKIHSLQLHFMSDNLTMR